MSALLLASFLLLLVLHVVTPESDRIDEYFQTSDRYIDLKRKHGSFRMWCRLEKTKANDHLNSASIIWEKTEPKKMLKTSDEYTVETNEYVNETTGRQFLFSNLTLKSSELKYAGYYQCHFTSKSGKILADRLFRIYASPLIKQGTEYKSYENGTYILPSLDKTEGESEELVCPLDGVPKPELSWWRNDQLIVTGSTLTLSNLTLDDRDNYECRATNVYGTAIVVQLIRVKGYLRALWPAIGIVGVFLSVGLIILIDKKRPGGPKLE